MSYEIVNNPSACPFGKTDCASCYWSQVNDQNQWTGTDECFSAGCLEAGWQPDTSFTGHELDVLLKSFE